MEDERLAVLAGQVNSILAERQKILRSLAGIKEIQQALSSTEDIYRNEASEILRYYQETLGMQVLYLMATDGTTIASSNYKQKGSFVGKNYSFRPYFKTAIETSSSIYFALGVTSGKRGIYHGQRALNQAGQIAGVLVAKESITVLSEQIASPHNGVSVLASPEDIVFISSNPEWLYKSLWQLSLSQREKIVRSKQFGSKPVTWLGTVRTDKGVVKDKQGKRFMIHRASIEQAPGWKILFFHDEEAVSATITQPLFRSVGLVTLFICAFVTAIVLLLYRYARTDMRQRQLAEDKLSESEEMFRSVAETATDAIISINHLGKIIFWNSSSQKIFGYSEQEALGQPVTMLIPGKLREMHKTGMSRVLSMGGHKIIGKTAEVAALRKNGEGFPIEISLATWESKGALVFTAIIRDISERKELERRLQDEKNELQITSDELKITNLKLKESQAKILQAEKMASVGQLAAGVAHEINNPMGFITSNLGTLDTYFSRLTETLQTLELNLYKRNDEEEIRLFERTKKANKLDYIIKDSRDLIMESLEGSERVKQIVATLKEFSGIDLAEEKPVAINSCLESSIAVLGTALRDGIRIVQRFADIPLLKGSPQLLNQAFFNLLQNAIQSIESDGEIIIQTQHDDQFIYVFINDTGRGIPEDELHKIFDPFYTSKDIGTGQGLGLSVALDIVKKHGGEITVKSQVNRGTTVMLKFPVLT